MKYRIVKQLKAKEAIPVEHGCRALETSRSGYYAALRRANEPAKACLSSTLLKAAFAASGRSYDSRRLRLALTPAKATGLAVIGSGR